MNLQISGHHLEITPALHDYVTSKLERVTRHFDHVIDVNVILSVEKLKQKAEVTVHLPGKDIFVEAIDEDLYAAIDGLGDIDKQGERSLRLRDRRDHHLALRAILGGYPVAARAGIVARRGALPRRPGALAQRRVGVGACEPRVGIRKVLERVPEYRAEALVEPEDDSVVGNQGER